MLVPCPPFDVPVGVEGCVPVVDVDERVELSDVMDVCFVCCATVEGDVIDRAEVMSASIEAGSCPSPELMGDRRPLSGERRPPRLELGDMRPLSVANDETDCMPLGVPERELSPDWIDSSLRRLLRLERTRSSTRSSRSWNASLGTGLTDVERKASRSTSSGVASSVRPR